MVKIDKKNYHEIISIDPVSLKAYLYFKNEIKPINLDKIKRNSFFASYIQSKNIISSTIEISRNIPDEDLQDAIEIKVYDELGLDSAVEYNITYSEIETNNTKNKTFNVFVIDSNILTSQFDKVIKKTKYIDYITTAPFLIQSLYKKRLIESDSVDCFVYFQKNDAFLAIYRMGEYLYSKSLHYSLSELNEKFCELNGERIDEDEFLKLLTTEGLKTTNLAYQSSLMKLFGELFLYINDVILFAKRSHEIEKIDKIFIGSEVGILIGVDEYAKSYLGLESFEFNFSIAINSNEWYIDQIHILTILSAQIYLEDDNEKFNFSKFKRPPPLNKRPSGKLLGVIAASLVLSLAFPAYQYGFSLFLNIESKKAKTEYKILNSEANRIRKEISTLKNERAKVAKIIEQESKKLEFRKKLLTQMYEKKINYPMKAKNITKIIKIINKYDSKISSIEYENRILKFYIQNSDDKKITELIKELTKLQNYKVSTDKIEKGFDKELYLSTIMVRI